MHVMNIPTRNVRTLSNFEFCIIHGQLPDGTPMNSNFEKERPRLLRELEASGIVAPAHLTYRQRMEQASWIRRSRVRVCDLVHIAPLSHSELISRRADADSLTDEERETIRASFVQHWVPVRKPAGWSLRQCRSAEIRELRRSSGCRGKNMPVQRANPGLYCGGGRMSRSAYPRANRRYLAHAQAEVITFQRVDADDDV